MFGWDFLLMLSRDSEDEMWSRLMFELLIWLQEVTFARWTQPSGPLCLWQCLQTNQGFSFDKDELCEPSSDWVPPGLPQGPANPKLGSQSLRFDTCHPLSNAKYAPMDDQVLGWFSLSVGDWARLVPFGVAVGGLSYLSIQVHWYSICLH